MLAPVLGIFDSGFGALAVLRGVREVLPDHDILCLSDSARCPYGDRDGTTIEQWTREGCELLFQRGARLIVLACNTGSSEALRALQQEWLPTLKLGQVNIIGIVRPIAEEATARTHTGRIGVIGTRFTVGSGIYEEEVQRLRPDATVRAVACPLLVPLVEEGWAEKPETRSIVRKYLLPLKSWNPDVLIPGCTHYNVLRRLIQRKMGRRCTVLDVPRTVVAKLQDYLQRHPEYDRQIDRQGRTAFLTTGDTDRFRDVGSRIYGRAIPGVERVSLPHAPGVG